jgi:hypothetical protein
MIPFKLGRSNRVFQTQLFDAIFSIQFSQRPRSTYKVFYSHLVKFKMFRRAGTVPNVMDTPNMYCVVIWMMSPHNRAERVTKNTLSSWITIQS